jgi:hypothetical protein
MPALTLSGQTRQRQIVILAVGGVLLAGLLLFQVPRTLKMLKGEEPLPPPSQTATPTPVAPVPTPAPGTPQAPVPVGGNSVVASQHVALTRFRTKDPFVQQINSNPAGSASSSESSAPAPAESEEASSEASGASFTAVESSSPSTAKERATIAVNGTKETVSVSGTFPEGNPVFKLVSLGDDTAKVGVASGSLKGGAQTVTLSKGEPLTLLNTVDGKRYRLELVAVGS